MTGSSPERVSGPLRLIIRPTAPLSEEHRQRLSGQLTAFVSTVRRGMFWPGAVEMASPLQVEPPCLGYLLSVRNLPLGALRVLKGMLACFSQQHAPLQHCEVERPGDIRDLFGVTADFPRAPREGLLFAIEAPGYLDGSSLELDSLSIRVEFREPPPAALRGKLLQPFEEWETLMCGGYPSGEGLSALSATGASSTRFIDPYTLEHHIDGIIAHPACFEPLINLALQWGRAGVSVARLELE